MSSNINQSDNRFKQEGKMPYQEDSGNLYTQSTAKRSGKKRLIIIGIVLLILLVGWTIFDRYFLKNKPEGEKSGVKPFNFSRVVPARKSASPINGEMIGESEAKKHPLAVVIENHTDARPQSGLSSADLVYEAIAEGGITRFLAVFGSKSSSEIGPVRSARTFFVNWASEYRAYFAHAGGAPDALDLIPKSSVYDLPHTQGYFERKGNGSVATEHTLFTSSESLYSLASSKKYPESVTFETLKYKDDAKPENRGEQASITIPFSSDSYTVSWTYDKENNLYLRSQAGSPHNDKNSGEQIKTKTIVVQTVMRTQIVPKEGAKPTFKFSDIGSGKATIYQDGKSQEGSWKKTDQKSRTRFYNQDGNEIEFNRGKMWLEIIPPDVTAVSR